MYDAQSSWLSFVPLHHPCKTTIADEYQGDVVVRMLDLNLEIKDRIPIIAWKPAR